MASSPLVTSLPTIPSSWTAPTSCFASTNWYRIFYSENFYSDLYGTPTPVFTGNAPTGACFPPSFTINVPYLTDGGCPTGYTRACAKGDTVSRSTVTCCPSVTGNAFSFTCNENEYGCHGTAKSDDTWTGVRTDINIPTPQEEPLTLTQTGGETIQAWGIKFVSVPPTSTTSSATVTTTASSPTPTPSNDASSSGLSSGAIAGIVVGVVAIIVILALIAFMVYRRKRKTRMNDPNYNIVSPNSSQGRNSNLGPPKDTREQVHEAPNTGLRGTEREAWELQG